MGISLAARRARGVDASSARKRAWGMPGAQCTRSLVCEVVVQDAHEYSQRLHRKSPGIPARDGFNGFLRTLPGDRAFLSPSSLRSLLLKNLAPASERQNHTTSPSASGHVRLTCPQRPPHPRPTYRDDRPKRPSSSRRDAREDGFDLPDVASADTCDRLARRAICAWGVCGICPSGKCVRGCKPRPSQPRAHASTARSGQAFFIANDHTFPARLTAAALAPWRHAEDSEHVC